VVLAYAHPRAWAARTGEAWYKAGYKDDDAQQPGKDFISCA
jgi:hypothetical protein